MRPAPTELHLLEPTPLSWCDRAVADPEAILLDHAHCEKKAAATAMNMLFRYPQHGSLLIPLSHLAREELLHFELVVLEIRRRGGEFERLLPSAYASEMQKLVRTHEPARLLDLLLLFAMIEARSCERMALLAERWTDPALSRLYRDLVQSEARHHNVYLELAGSLIDASEVKKRLTVFQAAEREACKLPPPEDGRPRMHSM